jgi:hypothetical protein
VSEKNQQHEIRATVYSIRLLEGETANSVVSTSLEVAVPPRGNAITWPFLEPRWHASVWMPFLWWAFPPFGLYIGLGWSLEAIRRQAIGDPQRLPRAQDLSPMMRHGFVVFLMTFLYFWIPLAVLAKIFEWNWLLQMWESMIWIWNAVLHRPQEPLLAFLTRQTLKLLANASVPALYVALAVPLFVAARIRYALSGKIRSFFNLLGGVLLILRHLGGMLLYLFLAAVTQTALVILGLLFATTGIGLMVSAILGGAGIWILSYLGGNLAQEVYQKDQSRKARTDGASVQTILS